PETRSVTASPASSPEPRARARARGGGTRAPTVIPESGRRARVGPTIVDRLYGETAMIRRSERRLRRRNPGGRQGERERSERRPSEGGRSPPPRLHRGCIRIAPSRRIVSPLRNW